MMQTLVQGLANKPDSAQLVSATPPASTAVVSGNDSQQQAVLLEMLTNIHNTLEANKYQATGQSAASTNKPVSQSINQGLQSENAFGKIGPLDNKSADVINLVTLLYEAIWKDESLPVVMKELIGRTQISIMKIALTDTSFFEDEQHPARVILKEFAMAGIAWTEKELLANDSA